MSKKTKTKSDEMLEQPAGEPVGEPQTGIDWPEATETRELPIELSDEQAHDFALDLIDTMQGVSALEREKKAEAKEFDRRISEKETRIEELQGIVRSKQSRGQVACHWEFEANGHDPDGNLKFHSGMKTLIRDDTGEAVEIKEINSADRQMVLPLSEQESHDANVKTLAAMGYTVEETPDDVEHNGAFQAVHSDGGATVPIYADSLIEAEGIAVAQLTAAAKAQAEETTEEAA